MVTKKCWRLIKSSKDEILFKNKDGRPLRVELGADYDRHTGEGKRRRWDVTIGSQRNIIDEDIKTKVLVLKKARAYMKKSC